VTTTAIAETERLVLRELTFDDVGDLFEIFSDPEAMRYYPSTKSLDETRHWVTWNRDLYARYGFGLWAVVLKETSEVVGDCGLVTQRVEGRDEVELGYHTKRGHWRQGIATEAGLACRGIAFEKLDLDRLISIIRPKNSASARVAEKVGLRPSRQIVYRGLPHVLYVLERTVLC
jgi:RimJ/RimL family protein N-acetyltransferase